MHIVINNGHHQFPGPYISSPHLINYFDQRLIDFCDQHRITNKVYTTKCIIVGDGGVGKTSLVQHYLTDEFIETHIPTVGVVFDQFNYKILERDFKIYICDTSSNEKFLIPNTTYFRNTNAIIILFDLTKLASFANIKKWYDYVYREMDNGNKPFVFIVGNKKDAVSKSVLEFTEEEAVQLSLSLSAEYWSISVRTRDNLDRLFKRIGALLFSSVILYEIEVNHIKRLAVLTKKLERPEKRKKKRRQIICFDIKSILSK